MMDNDTKEQLTDLFYAADLDPDEISWDYSGRGMYGKTCVGYTTADSVAGVVFALGRAVGQREADSEINWDLVEALSTGARTDSMGLSTIIYWPRIEGENDRG